MLSAHVQVYDHQRLYTGSVVEQRNSMALVESQCQDLHVTDFDSMSLTSTREME